MRVSYRSMLTSGVVALTATAVVAAPAITPVAQPAAERAAVTVPVQNTAAVTPFVSPLGSESAIKSVVPSAAKPAPGTPPAPRTDTPDIAPSSLPTNPSSGLIMNIYNAVEPWVEYGFELVEWAVGWVPWIGLLAGQIGVLYDAGEVLVRSWFQAAQDLVSLNLGDIPPTLINGITGGLSTLIQGEIDWVFGWLPPLPPGFPSKGAIEDSISKPFTAFDTTVDQVVSPVSGMLSEVGDRVKATVAPVTSAFLPRNLATSHETELAPAADFPALRSIGAASEKLSARVEALATSATEKLDPIKLLTGEKSPLARSDAKLKLPSLRDLQTQATEKVETVKDRAGARFQKVTDAADSVAKRLTKPFTSSANDAGKSDGAKSGYTPRTKIGQKVQQAAKSLASKVSKKDGPSD